MNQTNAQVIQALESALSVSPQNHDLRAHLVEILLAANRPADAFKEASTVLQEAPDHISALEAAMKAARALGNSDRAERYERLLQALRGSQIPVAPAIVAEKDDEEIDEGDEPSKEPAKIVPLRVLSGGTSDDSWRVEQTDLKLKGVGGLDSVKLRP